METRVAVFCSKHPSIDGSEPVAQNRKQQNRKSGTVNTHVCHVDCVTATAKGDRLSYVTHMPDTLYALQFYAVIAFGLSIADVNTTSVRSRVVFMSCTCAHVSV